MMRITTERWAITLSREWRWSVDARTDTEPGKAATAADRRFVLDVLAMQFNPDTFEDPFGYVPYQWIAAGSAAAAFFGVEPQLDREPPPLPEGAIP